jgi:hypothetical protein
MMQRPGDDAMFDADRVRELANQDGEFAIAARLWDATIGIDGGGAPQVLEIRGGRITRFERDEARAAKCDFRIAAPADEWAQMLTPVPRAFFHDLFAAMSREHFTIEGDLMSMFPYYPALRRLVEIMRAAPAR